MSESNPLSQTIEQEPFNIISPYGGLIASTIVFILVIWLLYIPALKLDDDTGELVGPSWKLWTGLFLGVGSVIGFMTSMYYIKKV